MTDILAARFEQRLAPLNTPAPIPTPISQPFWDAVAQHTFKLQRCQDCARWLFYPRGHCPHCWSDRLVWQSASGRGRLQTYSVVHKPGHPAWAAAVPYPLGVVALAEGPTLLTTLVVADPCVLQVGMALRVRFVQIGQVTLPMFEPEIDPSPQGTM